MNSPTSVEERLALAARTLDAEVERHAAARGVAGAPSYLDVDRSHRDPTASRSGARGRRIVAVAAAVAVVVGAAWVATRRDAERTDAVAPPAASSGGAKAADGEGWTDLPAPGVAPRFQHVVVGTDRGVLLWGGYDGSAARSDGAFFDRSQRRWSALPDAPLAGDRGDAVGVWTGTEVVLVNGIDGDVKAAAFDPSSFEWRALPDPPISNAANMMTRALVVDGTVVVVTVSEEGEGGARNEIATFGPGPGPGAGVGTDADRAGAWAIGEPPPGSFGSGFDAVVVGDEVIVVGRRGLGGKSCGEALVYAYAPASDRWRELPVGPLANVFGAAVVSTGTEVFVGGGVECGAVPVAEGRPDALLLDPATGVWRSTTPAPAPFRGDMRYPEVWSGRFAVGHGTEGQPVLYDPATDRWHVAPSTPLGRAYTEVPWVWHEGELLVMSGGAAGADGGCCRPVAGGYAYSPPYDWR